MPLTLKNARNPRWGSAARDFIIVDCEFVELPELGCHGFMASPRDPEPHGVEIFVLAKAGKFGPIADFEQKVTA